MKAIIRMKSIGLLIALLIPSSLWAQTTEYIASPDNYLAIITSTANPNRFHCENGNIEDIIFPLTVPLDAPSKGPDAFISYKAIKSALGNITQYRGSHDLHIICGGQIYSFNVIPKKDLTGPLIRMGDPNRKHIEANLELRKEKDIEQIYVEFITAANNNEFLGDVNITESFDTYPGLVQGVSIQQVRVMTMMGLGLRLKEFVLTAKPGTQVPADSFMLGQLSDSILAIATHPKFTNERGESRLFIVEPKL